MNATELAALWVERDRRYTVRKVYGMKMALTTEEEDAVRVWRRQEIDALPADERSAAWGVLTRWTPPIMSRR
jgi:hypothetical protein